MASQTPLTIPSQPATPQPSHASLPSTTAAVPKPQSKPPTRSTRASKTPTPPISPPPTIEAAAAPPKPLTTTMTPTEISTASPETLRAQITSLQRQLQETKTTTSAHHTLQLHMLAQESSAALERLAVEARMERHENEIIHLSSQRHAKAVEKQQPSLPEGCIAVNRDLYLRMGNEIRELRDANQSWREAHAGLERVVGRQESEIASLGDKVTLMRERIRENREHLNRVRGAGNNNISTPSRASLYGTPQRSQGLEALLQASEMTGLQPQSKRKAGGHTRNTHSLSSLPPTTPQRKPPGPPPMAFMTPSNRRTVAKVPATAPMPRTSALRTPTNVYSQPVLPIPQRERAGSDGTVSASDSDDEIVGDGMGGEGEDSEAETDILGHGDAADDAVEINESRASQAASQMLRASQQDDSGMKTSFASSGEALRQTKLFGAITKGNVQQAGVGLEGGLAAKRKRSEEDVGVARVGLGISGVRD
ncbi:hypothetical protein LTR17_020256 [Elasticomyces elasticus]|nr:hypothetical protein LTR17_020256 [Elasticomyces elasticus]